MKMKMILKACAFVIAWFSIWVWIFGNAHLAIYLIGLSILLAVYSKK